MTETRTSVDIWITDQGLPDARLGNPWHSTVDKEYYLTIELGNRTDIVVTRTGLRALQVLLDKADRALVDAEFDDEFGTNDEGDD